MIEISNKIMQEQDQNISDLLMKDRCIEVGKKILQEIYGK